MPIVLAVDPGPKESGVVAWDGARILRYGTHPNLHVIRVGDEYKTEYRVIEMVASYGMAVGETTFETVFWIGRFCQAWQFGHVDRMKRIEVKTHLCHDSRAKDANIRQALIDRFGEKGTKKRMGITYGLSAHTWQAFALAVTFYDRLTENQDDTHE